MPFSIRLYRHFYSIALFIVCLLSLSSMVSADSLWSGHGFCVNLRKEVVSS